MNKFPSKTVQDIIKAIIITFLCWVAITFHTQFSDNLQTSNENLTMHLMYSVLEQFKAQLLLASLNNNEKMKIAKNLLQNFKKTIYNYAYTDRLWFELDPKDKDTLKNKITDITASSRNLRLLWIGICIFIIFLFKILKNI